MKKQAEPPYKGVVDKVEAIGAIGSKLARYASRIPSKELLGVASGAADRELN